MTLIVYYSGAQMEEIIDKFLASAFGTDLNAKIIKCLKVYRCVCVCLREIES